MTIRFCAGLIIFAAAPSLALADSDKPYTATFQGSGRQCRGQLAVRAKTITWRTPFASCPKTPYEIIKNSLNTSKPEIVFLLKGKPCGFGVITLDWNSEYPNYWNANGYRSLQDYKSESSDHLRCNLEKEGK